MANSVEINRNGPLWPLGIIVVPTPGTPVSLMSLVDPSSLQAPETPTTYGGQVQEYTVRCQQIIFQGVKAGAGPPRVTNNSGNVYVVLKPTAGAGGVADVGNIVVFITPGQTFILASAALNMDVFSPYEIFLDADTANDGALVSLIIQ
jgi:hypothetical protein